MPKPTIRNYIEQVERVYNGQWKPINFTNSFTMRWPWYKRIQFLFTGKLEYSFEFSCSIKGEVFITGLKVDYKLK